MEFLSRNILAIETFVFVLMIAGCRPAKKECTFQTENQELAIYRVILTDLVQNRMHGLYLGSDNIDKLREEYVDGEDDVDTAKLEAELIHLHNEVFQNPSRFCILYLDTVSARYKFDSAFFQRDSEFKTLIQEYTNNFHGAFDSLHAPQLRYTSTELNLCTASIEIARRSEQDTTCAIGQLWLSKIVLNELKNRALVFYDWHCAPELCGHAGYLKLSRRVQGWTIEDFDLQHVY